MKPVNAPKDFLTNCYTREGILPFLKKMEGEYLNSKKPFSVLIMDVDHFKSFNDKFGHLYGDEVLKYFSSSMRLDLEDEENAPFRFGGDEFVMVFPNKTAGDAYRLAGRLRKNIRTRSCLIKGRQISVTFSGGIAGYPADANTVDDVLEKADKALYYSKNHGRSRITKYSDLSQKEFLQISLIAVILAIVGTLVYFYRDPLSSGMNKITPSYTHQKPGAEPGIAHKESAGLGSNPANTTAAQPQGPAAKPEESSEISDILLESGRVITGVIRHQDADAVEVEVSLQEGKGILLIKKSQIVRIEKGQKAVQ